MSWFKVKSFKILGSKSRPTKRLKARPPAWLPSRPGIEDLNPFFSSTNVWPPHRAERPVPLSKNKSIKKDQLSSGKDLPVVFPSSNPGHNRRSVVNVDKFSTTDLSSPHPGKFGIYPT